MTVANDTMAAEERPSPADIADRHRRYVALAMLAAAAMSLANAAERLVQPDLVAVTAWVQAAMVVAIVGALIPLGLWKLRNRDADLRYLYMSEDGFVAQSLQRAKSISWVTTFVFLSGLATVAERLDSVPSEVFTYLTTTVMLGVFSGAFLFLDRDGGEVPIGSDA